MFNSFITRHRLKIFKGRCGDRYSTPDRYRVLNYDDDDDDDDDDNLQ